RMDDDLPFALATDRIPGRTRYRPRGSAALFLRRKTPPQFVMKVQSFEGKLIQLWNRNAAWKICAALCLITDLVTPLSSRAQENPEVAPRAIPVNAGPNDVARFLAGIAVPENSPLAPLT